MKPSIGSCIPIRSPIGGTIGAPSELAHKACYLSVSAIPAKNLASNKAQYPPEGDIARGGRRGGCLTDVRFQLHQR
jgi:hypothetical protein